MTRFSTNAADVVDLAFGRARLVGGSRSGKTTALLARANRLSRSGESVLFITAPPMRGEVARALSAERGLRNAPVHVHHWDSLAAFVLDERQPSGAEQAERRKPIRPEVETALIAEVLSSLHGDRVHPDDEVTERIVLARRAYVASWLGPEELRTHAEASDVADRWDFVLNVAERFDGLCRDRGLIDSCTALIEATLVLRSNVSRWRSHFRHIVVDDHESATFAHHRLLMTLASPAIEHEGTLVIAGSLNGPTWDGPVDGRWFRNADRYFSVDVDVTLPDPASTPAIDGVLVPHRALLGPAIVGEVQSLLAAGNTADGIAIIVPPTSAGYATIRSTRRAADRCGVPIEGREKVADDPVARSVAELVAGLLTDSQSPPRLPDSLLRLGLSYTSLAAGVSLAGGDPVEVLHRVWDSIASQLLSPSQDRGATPARQVPLRSVSALRTLINATREAVEAGLSPIDAITHGLGMWHHHGRGVHVLTDEQARGRSFQHVVVTGFEEGTRPGSSRLVQYFDPEILDGPDVASEQQRHHLAVAESRLRVDHLTRRGRQSCVVIAAPEPGILPSRFTEGRPLRRPTIASPEPRPTISIAETDNDYGFWRDRQVRASASSISTFVNCPLEHTFKYVFGIETDSGASAMVGTITHEILERFFDPNAEPLPGEDPRGLQRLQRMFDERWDDSDFTYRAQAAEYRNTVWALVLTAWTNDQSNPADIAAVERRFEMTFGEHLVAGSIDRIDRVATNPENGRPLLSIVDYKTGARTNGPAANDSLQLGLYYLATLRSEDLRSLGDPHELALYWLKDGQFDHQPIVDDLAEIWTETITDHLTLISAGAHEPSPEANCEYCSFQRVCPTQEIGRNVAIGIAPRLRIAPQSHIAPHSHIAPAAPGLPNASDLSVDLPADPVEQRSSVLHLDDGQQRAIDAPLVPVRINAGAGSGKTTVMAHRVRSLVGRGVRADQILGLTFSNKAAENLRRRIVKDVDAGLDVAVSTYHGYGAGIVRDFALELGFRKSPTLIDRGTAFGLLYETLHDLEFEHRKVGRPADLVSAALRLASQCADHLVSLEAVIQNCNDLDADQTVLPEVRKAARGRRDLASIAKQFEVAKRKHGLIDFGDQIAGAVRVLEQHPEVAATLRDRHPVVLLDEYQDTNFAQRRLLQLIYPPGSPITVVGDDMQSIYAFRGAHLENLLRFDDHFVSPNSSTDTFVEATLETNYRSGSRVVSLANHVASTVDVTLPKTLRAGPTAISDHIEYALGADDDDEAHLIANWVLDRGAPWSETAILARKRKLFPVIAKALEGVGVPVEIVGIGGLLHRPEVVDTLAWLEVIALEDPNIAVLRLFRSPLRAIGMNDIALLSQHAKVRAREANPTVRYPKTSLLDAIANVDHCLHVSSEAWARCKAFGADLHHLQRIADRVRLPELLEAIFDVERLFDRCDDVGQENLLRLLDIADTFDPVVGTSTPRSFLEFLELVKASEDEPAEASATDSDAVRVMTIHQSKGLEFDNVAVAGLSGKGSSTYFPDDRMAENGATNTAVLPLWLRADNAGFTSPPRTRNALEASRAHAKNERINEERRLLYVALTRARQHLFATAAHWYGETKSPQGPSSFYELISAHNTSVERRPAADAPPESPLVRRRRERSVAVAVVNDRAITKATVAGTARGASKRRSFPTADQASLLGNAAAAEEAPANTETNVNAAPWQARSIGTKTPISATSLVSLARCKRQFEWSAVTPLPQRASRAAERGTTIHAAVASYLQASPSGRAKMNGDPIDHEGERRDGATDLLAMFASSPWPLLPLFGTEVRLAGSIGGFDVTARVDALFGSADPTKSEHLTIVDWKTTRPALVGETPNDLQLDVTAVLAVQLYRLEPEQLRTSFVHLRPNGIFEQSKEWTAELLTEARSRLEPLLHASQGPTFLEQPGPWCRRCPFEAFCPGAVVAQRQGRLL